MEAYNNAFPSNTKPSTDSNEKGFAKIALLLEATGGLSLSQVCAVTGLEASTIQNWVKRGWVAHPIGKRYEEVHIARILIINALKDCLKLEHISKLMIYLNGKAKDGSEAIVRESDLYNYLGEAMKRSGQMGDSSRGGVETIIDNVISDYNDPNPASRAKLRKALTLMMLACVCTDVKRRTEAMMGQILKEVDDNLTLPQPRTAARPQTAAQPKPAATVQKPTVATSARQDTVPTTAVPAKPAAASATAATAKPAAAPTAATVKPPVMPQAVTPIRITLDDPEEPVDIIDEAAQTRKTISQALREWDISSVEKIIIDHDEEARNNAAAQAEAEAKKPANRPWYIRKNNK